MKAALFGLRNKGQFHKLQSMGIVWRMENTVTTSFMFSLLICTELFINTKVGVLIYCSLLDIATPNEIYLLSCFTHRKSSKLKIL